MIKTFHFIVVFSVKIYEQVICKTDPYVAVDSGGKAGIK